jgi:hypothetical protein
MRLYLDDDRNLAFSKGGGEMLATLQERLYRSEANELRSIAEELRASIPTNAAGMHEQEVRERTDLAQQLVDHLLATPQRMRQTVQESKARASTGELTDLKNAGEALTSLLAQSTNNLKLLASVANAIRDAGYSVERVDRLPATIVEMVKLTEETIQTWPWPEDWWPAVDPEMLKRSYEKGEFLTLEEAIRELPQRTPE